MNAIGYDLAAIGNNEFKLKDAEDAHDAAGAQAALAKLIAPSRFPWICANATEADGSPLPGVKPFIVMRIGKLRVAFLGLTTGRSSAYPQTKGLKIIDPVEAAKVWIPKARAEADVRDRGHPRSASPTTSGWCTRPRGIDAVVGGDCHTYLYQPLELEEPRRPGHAHRAGRRVRRAARQVRPHLRGRRGARLAARALRRRAAAGRTATLKPDPALAALAERYAAPLDVRGRPDRAHRRDARASGWRSPPQDLAAAWKAAAGTDVGLQPEGDLFEVFRTPAVTRFQVHAIVPFHDTIWKGEISGARLQALLAKPTLLGGVMHATIAPADIDPAKTYTVATTDFVAQAAVPGGVDTHRDARDAIEAWLKSKPGG